MKQEIREYTLTHHAKERAPGETDAQFIYNVRKKSWKIMKRRFADLPDAVQVAKRRFMILHDFLRTL